MKVARAAIFLVVIGLGWKFPLLSYCMLLDVALGIYGALKHGGRYGCGNYCPRGAFYSFMPDTGRKLPAAFLKGNLSLVFLPALLAVLILWQRPGSISGFGRTLYWLIAITSTVGIAGALVFNRGFWCAVCPMGKMLRRIRPAGTAIRVDPSCVQCGLCAKACPFQFNPPAQAEGGDFRDRDCLRCGLCVRACRKGALSIQRQ
ncbi:MAG: 4Fe-4S binding protein [Kiritimatiellia bacterium]|jgi:ferredoxin-type protein NapH